MAKAAAIASDALKRSAQHFTVDEEPSSHGSLQKHAGGRPAKRQARAELHSRFEVGPTGYCPPRHRNAS
jgi:syntaxin 7